MPIYEFVCQACGSDFEKIQSFSDSSTPICPKCQSEQVQRRMSRPAIHFKGSGWYITDSKADNNKEKKEGAKNTEPQGTNGAGSESAANESAGATTGEASSKDTPAKSDSKADTATTKEAAKASSAPEKKAEKKAEA